MGDEYSHNDSQHRIALLVGTFIGGGVGAMWGTALGGAFGAMAGGLMMGVGSRFFLHFFLKGSSRAVSSFLLPDDRGGGGVGYSHIEALEARGDYPGALAAWEEAIGANPEAIAARIKAAELYASKGNNPQRASQLYREVQSHPKASDETRRYVTQRLIDLYLGPLRDEGKALVELRRVANRWPDSPEGKGALEAIAKIKNL